MTNRSSNLTTFLSIILLTGLFINFNNCDNSFIEADTQQVETDIETIKSNTLQTETVTQLTKPSTHQIEIDTPPTEAGMELVEPSTQQVEIDIQPNKTLIADVTIKRARAGNGNDSLNWEFLSKKLEALSNGVESIDINEENIQDENLTALHYAAILGGDIDITKMLLHSGADVNKRSNHGKTPLHMAIRNGGKEIAKLLIHSGTYVNKKDNDGKTSLHLAAYCDQREIAELLICRGADVHATDNDNKTPLDLAIYLGKKEIAALLMLSS